LTLPAERRRIELQSRANPGRLKIKPKGAPQYHGLPHRTAHHGHVVTFLNFELLGYLNIILMQVIAGVIFHFIGVSPPVHFTFHSQKLRSGRGNRIGWLADYSPG
jgi:hypothetical protein